MKVSILVVSLFLGSCSSYGLGVGYGVGESGSQKSRTETKSVRVQGFRGPVGVRVIGGRTDDGNDLVAPYIEALGVGRVNAGRWYGEAFGGLRSTHYDEGLSYGVGVGFTLDRWTVGLEWQRWETGVVDGEGLSLVFGVRF